MPTPLRILPLLALAACTGGTKVPPDGEGKDEHDVATPHAGSEHAVPTDPTAIETKDDAKRAQALRAALEKEPTRASAHLDLAATLARLRATGETCAHGATLDEILTHLERALALDATLSTKVKATSELSVVSSTVRYHIAMGASLTSDASVATMLADADFYGPPSGVLPFTGTLDLQSGGAAAGTTRALGDGGPEDTPFEGTWTQLSGAPGLTLSVSGSDKELTLTAEGKLMDQDKVAWVNLPAECSA